jgi:ADP-heptose:LPS heptosyltransferase
MPARRSLRPSLGQLEASNVAIIKPSALGDIVHALPVLPALRRRFPGARLTWIVNRAYQPLLDGHPDLDATLPFDRSASQRGAWRGVASYLRFLGELRALRFDLVLDLQGLARSASMTIACGWSARRVGFASAREGARWAYTDLVEGADPKRHHAVDRYWRVAEALGAGDGPRIWRVPISEAARQWAREQLADLPRPWIAVAVGSRWPTKCWPPASFAALLQPALEHSGGSAFFVGGSEDAAPTRATRGRLRGVTRDFVGRTTLPQLAALLEFADVMAANDTGPLHLAAALGRPVVAPYTCTRVQLTGPYGQAHRAVEAPIWCQGSCLKRCRRMECMEALTPDLLQPALNEVLRAWHARQRTA